MFKLNGFGDAVVAKGFPWCSLTLARLRPSAPVSRVNSCCLINGRIVAWGVYSIPEMRDQMAKTPVAVYNFAGSVDEADRYRGLEPLDVYFMISGIICEVIRQNCSS